MSIQVERNLCYGYGLVRSGRQCFPVVSGDLDVAGPAKGSGATRIEADLSINK
jgi:hypothetical protein